MPKMQWMSAITLVERMQKLSPEEFEGMLRPAFKEDEWSLIIVGAVLGFCWGNANSLYAVNLNP